MPLDADGLKDAPFDLEQALNYMDGDRELFLELVSVFMEESERQLNEIHSGIASGDAKVVERAAHSIKGSLSTFAAARATEAARTLEFLGRDGNLAEFPAAMAALEKEIALVKDALLKVSRDG